MIYLDAAFDRTPLMEILMPYYLLSPLPTETDSASIEHYKAYKAKNMGVVVPEEEIKSTTVFSRMVDIRKI